MSLEKVRYAELLPHEFRRRLALRPLAYLPLGTLEWHGEHLPLGSDAIISEGLMVECARRYGGIVMPPIYLGPDRKHFQPGGTPLIGMDRSDVTVPHRQLDGSCYWVSQGLFFILIDAILEQLQRAGFKAIFADGHGPSRWSWVEYIDERTTRYGLTLLGVTPEIRAEWTSQIDHAAANETSLVMAMRPELVDLTRLAEDRDVWPQGVGGDDPRDATAEHGRDCLETAVQIVGRLLTDAGI
jgi:creatinine amidohydrolase